MDVRLIRTFSKAPNTSTGRHHRHTGIGHGIPVPFMRHIYIVSHHRGNLFGHFHRDHSRLFRRVLITRLRSAFSSSVSFGSLKAANTRSYASLSRVYIPDQPFTNDGCLRRDCPHLAFHIGIFLLTDRQVCHHLGKCRRNSPVQSRDTSPPGTGALPAVSARNPLIVKSTSIVSII